MKCPWISYRNIFAHRKAEEKKMKKLMVLKALLFLTLLIALAILLPLHAQAVTYSGSLSANGGGIVATDGWDTSGTVLSWTVSDVGMQDGYVLWQYDYNFTVPFKNISHVIIEVSPDAQDSDFTILSGSSLGVAIYDGQGNSNPNMPEAMTGIKFGPDGLDYSFSFTTTRAPVWGDFYAKDGSSDGTWVTAWNEGFTSPDSDPIAAPSSGSLQNHILRPDTVAIVPEPVSSTLFILGGTILGFRRYRKIKKG
jgi:hypothetical protein